MVKSFLLLFVALRAADLLNLAGGLYLVPKYVAPEDLGAVLPLTTFATVLAIPLYAIAMTALRESARLRAEGLDAHLRSFIRGIFAAVGLGAVITLALSAALLPRFLVRFRLTDSLSGHLAVAAAFLGCVAPVYLDQLQAAKRFGAVSVIEVSAAALRLAAMTILMPLRALAGYFAGGIVKTLVQILGPLIALRKCGRGVLAADDNIFPPYWTHSNLLRLAKTILLLLPYLALPMIISFAENDLVRTLLPPDDSAGYYMATRISDLMNYLTYPILFVMFPYVTDRAVHGKSHLKPTLNACGVVIGIALAAMIITYLFGAQILALLPNGGNYSAYAAQLPWLVLFMAFGAVQSIITNAEVAAGKFTFLWWFLPLNVAYVTLLPRLTKSPTLDSLIAVFLLFAVLRAGCAMLQLRLTNRAARCESPHR